MTQAEKMRLLKAKDNEMESDESLSAALLTAQYAIMTRAYPYVHDITILAMPTRYDMLQIDIANVLVKKAGAEGEIVHMENGIHRHYESADVPESMLMPVIPQVGTF